MKKLILSILLLLVINSCAMSGASKDDGMLKLITGATKVDATQDVHVVNMIRAIGVPNNIIVSDKFKYYQWEYSKSVSISTILVGGSTTLYCRLSVETQREKIKLINWYGNKCAFYLDQIKHYFSDKLNIIIVGEEDSKGQVVNPKKDKTTLPDSIKK